MMARKFDVEKFFIGLAGLAVVFSGIVIALLNFPHLLAGAVNFLYFKKFLRWKSGQPDNEKLDIIVTDNPPQS